LENLAVKSNVLLGFGPLLPLEDETKVEKVVGAVDEAGGSSTAVTAGAVTDGAVTDGAVTDGAVTDGAVTDGAVTDGAVTMGAVDSGTDGSSTPVGLEMLVELADGATAGSVARGTDAAVTSRTDEEVVGSATPVLKGTGLTNTVLRMTTVESGVSSRRCLKPGNVKLDAVALNAVALNLPP
jgi:hypothetical protein